MPPTWLHMRDRKAGYDVSVPHRAQGYLSVLSFSRDAEAVMGQLKAAGEKVFADYRKRMESQMQEAGIRQRLLEAAPGEWVLEYRDLASFCQSKTPQGFGKWYEELCGRTEKELAAGRLNYPQAALEMMDALLTFSGITRPVMVIAFAPPYYPAFHSDRLDRGAGAASGREMRGGAGTASGGKQQRGTALFEMLAASAKRARGLRLVMGNYFCGISDLSYCGGQGAQALKAYEENSPLWGRMYSMDREAMSRFQVPSLLFGPVSKDAHQISERVNRKSLLEDTPAVIREFIEQMFVNNADI